MKLILNCILFGILSLLPLATLSLIDETIVLSDLTYIIFFIIGFLSPALYKLDYLNKKKIVDIKCTL